LRQNNGGTTDDIEVSFEIAGGEMGVRAGDYDYRIVAIRGDCDLSYARGCRRDIDGADVNTGGAEASAKFHPETIVANFADQADCGAQPGSSKRLVPTLSTGKGAKTRSGKGFAGDWNVLCLNNQVEIDTANHQKSFSHEDLDFGMKSRTNAQTRSSCIHRSKRDRA
jgi:hypothetical protein